MADVVADVMADVIAKRAPLKDRDPWR